jgi:DNA-binding PadR family transcriptional regulator
MISNFAVDYVILGCLSIQPMSGYDIKRLIGISTSLFYNASYGSIYPTLRKMEEAGLVNSEESVENGRFKKTYSLTAEGKHEFMEWLEEPPRPIVIKNDMLLRLFFYRHLPREKIVSITASHIEQLRAFKLELEEIEAQEGAIADKFQQYTLCWGKDFYDFQIGWYEKLLHELDHEANK